jgi:hypothetical protein
LQLAREPNPQKMPDVQAFAGWIEADVKDNFFASRK